MLDIIQEALRELASMKTKTQKSRRLSLREDTEKRRRKLRALADLWDQVYCSLTDGGADSAYAVLGNLNGRGKYYVKEIETDTRFRKAGFDPIAVVIKDPSESDLTDAQFNELQRIRACGDIEERREKFRQFKQKLRKNRHTLDWAKHVAEVYGLETRQISNEEIVLYVPKNAPVRLDLTTRGTIEVDTNDEDDDVDEAFEDITLDEDFDRSLPVQPLPEEEIYNFISNIPVPAYGIPPKPFSVGYIRELKDEIASKFRGGRGSAGNPVVRIIECLEATVSTGYSYESRGKVKAQRKLTGKEPVGRANLDFTKPGAVRHKIGVSSIGNRILRCYPKSDTKIRYKYFISVDGEDLRETSKEEIVQYLTASAANAKDKDIFNFKLSGIYKLGNLGYSIM